MSLIWEKVLWDGVTIKILKMLSNGEKRFSDFVAAGIPRTTLDRRLKQLGVLELIELKKNFAVGTKTYRLTELGRKVLWKLIELEEIYEEEMKKAPPKGEEFLEGERKILERKLEKLKEKLLSSLEEEEMKKDGPQNSLHHHL